MSARCFVCGDPSPDVHCARCVAWSDLILAFRFGDAGLDEHRLQRARRYFARQGDPLARMLAKLAGRVSELEEATA